jgi:Fe-Mn family superoxide dismutase
MKQLTKLIWITVLMITIDFQTSHAQQQPTFVTQASYSFPALPYGYDALEPYIDKMTMEIHYSKHHRAYFDNFIKAVTGTQWDGMALKDIFATVSTMPVSVRNNGGGYYNHILFWENMAPQGQGGVPSLELKQAIENTFGSHEEFVKQFNDAAKSRFGSGWAWLSVDDQGKLFISSTPNQDNPLMDVADKRGTPILALDVWEHAYYLKYQNRRVDYIDAFWSVVNWTAVNQRYLQTR